MKHFFLVGCYFIFVIFDCCSYIFFNPMQFFHTIDNDCCKTSISIPWFLGRILFIQALNFFDPLNHLPILFSESDFSIVQLQVGILKRVLEEVEKVMHEFKGTLYKSMEDPHIDLTNVSLVCKVSVRIYSQQQ